MDVERMQLTLLVWLGESGGVTVHVLGSWKRTERRCSSGARRETNFIRALKETSHHPRGSDFTV